MAEINVRGYVNKPESKESAKGGYSKFTLAESQKQKDGTKKKVYYDCVDFANAEPPKESSFVTISGWFSVNEYESKAGKNAGKTMQGLNINVQKLEVAESLDNGGGGKSAAQAAPPSDPFALNK